MYVSKDIYQLHISEEEDLRNIVMHSSLTVENRKPPKLVKSEFTKKNMCEGYTVKGPIRVKMDDNSETTPISFPEDLGDKHCAKVVSVFGVFLVRFLPHSNQKNSEYGYFSRSDNLVRKNAFL